MTMFLKRILCTSGLESFVTAVKTVQIWNSHMGRIYSNVPLRCLPNSMNATNIYMVAERDGKSIPNSTTLLIEIQWIEQEATLHIRNGGIERPINPRL